MGGRWLPEGYIEIGRWTLKQASVKDVLLLALVGLVTFFASLTAAGFVVGAGSDPGEMTINGGTFFSGLLLGCLLGVTLHEAVHSICFLAFGGRPRFGFKPWTKFGPVFYASAPGSYLDRPRYVVAGLAPAVLLTAALAAALAFVAANDLLASAVTWAFVLNAAGSAGDMVMMRKVMSYPRATRFEDTGEGFVAYGPSGRPGITIGNGSGLPSIVGQLPEDH